MSCKLRYNVLVLVVSDGACSDRPLVPERPFVPDRPLVPDRGDVMRGPSVFSHDTVLA